MLICNRFIVYAKDNITNTKKKQAKIILFFKIFIFFPVLKQIFINK